MKIPVTENVSEHNFLKMYKASDNLREQDSMDVGLTVCKIKASHA